MSSYCKVIVLGNLTRDIEIRYTPKGSAVADFQVAVNRKWRSETGEAKEEVTFVGCVAFGKQAETLAQYLKKGSQIFIEGRLRQETWEDKDTGKKREKTKVAVEGFQFIGGRQDEHGPPRADTSAPRGGTRPTAAAPASEPTEDEDQDVPF